jgi:hypothetical protein
MIAPLRPMLLALGALSLGGVLVLKSAHASEPSTFETAVDSKAKDGGGWTTLGGKEGGSIELAGKDGGVVELSIKGKDGGVVELSIKGKDGGSIELSAKGDGGK